MDFLHKTLYTDPGSYSEIRKRFFTPSPASNVSSPSATSFEREGSGAASLDMMRKIYLTPEAQETIQKSKDPSLIMAAHGTAHTTEQTTVFACDLDMCVQVQFLKETRTLAR